MHSLLELLICSNGSSRMLFQVILAPDSVAYLGCLTGSSLCH